MTDAALLAAKELAEIGAAVKTAGQALKRLSKRSARRLALAILDGKPTLIDADRAAQLEADGGGASRMLADGGSVVARFDVPGNWAGDR